MDSTATSQKSLVEQLVNKTYLFDFHQAFRVLEAVIPGMRQEVKRGIRLHQTLQLKSNVYLSAPASALFSLTFSEESIHLTVNFLGLAGLQGPLPTPYVEQILHNLKEKDTAAKDFLDIFNHRLLTLYRRIGMELGIGSSVPPEESSFGQIFRALSGIALPSLHHQTRIPDRSLVGHSPLLWQKPNAIGVLETLIRRHFQVPARLSLGQGKWRSVHPSEVCRIGVGAYREKGNFNSLGVDSFMGQRFWEENDHLLLRLGPLSLQEYRNFLPQQKKFLALRDLCALYLPPHCDVGLQLTIEAEEMPLGRLGHSALGLTSALGVAKEYTVQCHLH